jgi:hypothetical protein
MFVDLNFLSGLSAAEVARQAQAVFFAPGDYVLSLILEYAPSLARAAGLTTADYGGLVPILFSSLFWLAVLLLLRACYLFVRELFRTVFASIRNACRGVLRVARASRTAIVCLFKRPNRAARQAALAAIEEIELNDLELAVLRVQGRLAPGYIVTARDVARRLAATGWQVQQALARLRRLQLVDTALGSGDGEEGYRLTSLGKHFVEAHGWAGRPAGA